jgi:flavin reductase (DIM6/NTAB) family NADH-FMN oxidoreductase RutF
LPQGESELGRIPVSLTEFEGFSLPRISQCRVALACELYSTQRIGAEQLLILGQVHKLYVADEACEKDARGRSRIRADVIDPIGRLGADEYCTMGDVITLRRPA